MCARIRSNGFGAINSTTDHEVAECIRSGAGALGETITSSQILQIADYLALLVKWNRNINLTAIDDRLAAVRKHILDSLAALQFVRGPRVIDIGSGAGLPGIPLAIARPQYRFRLLDARRKRVQFLLHAVTRLRLTQVDAIHGRVEQQKGNFDTLTVRAFGHIPDFVAMSGHLCRPGGRILAWKGVYPTAELEGLPRGFTVAGVHPLRVPGLDAARHVVVIERGSD